MSVAATRHPASGGRGGGGGGGSGGGGSAPVGAAPVNGHRMQGIAPIIFDGMHNQADEFWD